MPTPQVEYKLDIYENSFINDPTAIFESSTPFMTFSRGDYIDLSGLGYAVPDDKWLEVITIRHRVAEIGAKILHQVGLCVQVMDVPSQHTWTRQ